MSRFYDDMYERLEDAADRAVLVRYRTICPLLSEADIQAMWAHMLRGHNRVERRRVMNGWFDAHDLFVSEGLPGMFAPNGDVLDD